MRQARAENTEEKMGESNFPGLRNSFLIMTSESKAKELVSLYLLSSNIFTDTKVVAQSR